MQKFEIVKSWGFLATGLNTQLFREFPFNNCDKPTHREVWNTSNPDKLVIMDLKTGLHETTDIKWSLFI